MNKKYLTGLSYLILLGCVNNSSNNDKIAEKQKMLDWSGYFADDSYNRRSEGYDWKGVITSQINDSTVHVSVRSRADKKRATCTFDVDASIVNDSTLTASIEGLSVYFIMNATSFIIRTQSAADEDRLSNFCSGGASIAGQYQRQHEPLDEQQVDKTIFLKNLSIQNVFFEVRSVRTDSVPVLVIETFGLKNKTNPIHIDLKNQMVVDAEVEDLNADGSPELLVYTSVMQRNEPVQVIGFSVNNGKSMSMITMPELKASPEAFKGYRGRDECRIVENRLVRRFPLAGKSKDGYPLYRFVTYKMVEGEAARRFEIESIR